jgi:hypothetical protein
MRISSIVGSVEGLRRKLRAVAAVVEDPAATEHEKANAQALKSRLQHRLREAGSPAGDWTDNVFRLGRWAKEMRKNTSPVAFLEGHVGVQLLHRTTRSIKLSEAGKRYAAACRRMLTDLEEADVLAAGERSAPRGTLTLTAPVAGGEEVLRRSWMPFSTPIRRYRRGSIYSIGL